MRAEFVVMMITVVTIMMVIQHIVKIPFWVSVAINISLHNAMTIFHVFPWRGVQSHPLITQHHHFLVVFAVFPPLMTELPRCFHPQRSQQWSWSHYQGHPGGPPFHIYLHHRLPAPPQQQRSEVRATVPLLLLSLEWFDRHLSSKAWMPCFDSSD